MTEHQPLEASCRKPSAVATGLLAAVLVGLWLLIWFQIELGLPRAKKTFDGYGLQLPALTKEVLVLRYSGAVSWFFTAPGAIGLAVAGGGLVGFLRHSPGWRRAGWPLIVVVLAGLLGLNVVVGGSLLLTQFKLQEALARQQRD